MFGMFRSISLTFRVPNEAKLMFRVWIHYFGVPKLRSVHATTLAPKWCLGLISAISLNDENKSWVTFVSDLYALHHVTEVAKHPFYSIRPKMMFWSFLEHFVNIRHVKRCKICVSGLNALFRGTEVAKHPSYYIGTKMMFGSDLDHFANLQT
jgi:hypothetical protein